MIKFRVFMSQTFSSSVKLKICGGSIVLSAIILFFVNMIDPANEGFGLLYTVLLYGNIILCIYVYLIHNARIDLAMLKRKAKEQESQEDS
ncbi:hypothetical protein AOC36_00130 [Erysipelothrix larvae]|uniref:Uncharacterized protein n=1 Tax=Erysipelothrix larvae TaxID=1514105 RepID=A0A0X8GXX2_9FIRM|nr:hypothetical protein [Erysipelothrix larvae]AMC92454.1 hypothetical protein AOC36_00130 [Erysipelothrix larvae]